MCFGSLTVKVTDHFIQVTSVQILVGQVRRLEDSVNRAIFGSFCDNDSIAACCIAGHSDQNAAGCSGTGFHV